MIEDNLIPSDIKTSAIKSMKWTVLSEIVSRSISPIVTLILARILTPADFGIVGVAAIAIGLVQIFQDFGLGKTLIQREKNVEESANIIFWSNIIFSLFLYLILFITTPLISKFFNESRIIGVLRILCLQLILFSFISVHGALFQRNFKFKQIFFIRLFSSIVTGLISVPLALSGYGVWALVFGNLSGAVVAVFLYWKISPWRPRLNYDFKLAKQLFSFGIWVTLEAFLVWVIGWGDSIVLGHFLGVRELGIYRTGITFLILVFGIFFNPILPVAYSTFSRLQSNQDELRQSFLKMTKLIASISLPLGIGLAILAQPISSIVFGQRWQGIEIVIAIMGIMHSIGWLVGINSGVYTALGRPDVNSKLLIATVIYYIPVYVFAAPYGLLVFCIARITIAIVSMGLHIFIANRVLNLPYAYLINCIKQPFIGSLILAIVVYPAVNLTGTFVGLGGWLKISGIISFGGIIYILALWLLEKETILQFLKIAKESVK